MLRFILFVVSTVILYTLLRVLIKSASPRGKRVNRSAEPEELVQDPCCQTYIPKRLAIRKTVAGKEYYFCNQDCLHKFLKDSRSNRS
jgi:YHS domain-containing protein